MILALALGLGTSGCVDLHTSSYRGGYGYSQHSGYRGYDRFGYSHYHNPHYERERQRRYEQACPKRDRRWYQPWRSNRVC